MKTCIIENGKFAWILRVDSEIIEFQSRSSAIYFVKHYADLGYDIEIINDVNLLYDVINVEGTFRVVDPVSLDRYTCMISNGKVLQWSMSATGDDSTKGSWLPCKLSIGEVIRNVR